MLLVFLIKLDWRCSGSGGGGKASGGDLGALFFVFWGESCFEGLLDPSS